jgi:hypothetical protein
MALHSSISLPSNGFPGFQPIGHIYSYKFSGGVKLHDDEDADHNSSLDEVNWLGQDWALIRIANPKFLLPNKFCVGSNRIPTQVNGYLRNEDLIAGRVSILSVNGAVHGTLNGSEASMMIEHSYFTVRSIALDRQLGK